MILPSFSIFIFYFFFVFDLSCQQGQKKYGINTTSLATKLLWANRIGLLLQSHFRIRVSCGSNSLMTLVHALLMCSPSSLIFVVDVGTPPPSCNLAHLQCQGNQCIDLLPKLGQTTASFKVI